MSTIQVGSLWVNRYGKRKRIVRVDDIGVHLDPRPFGPGKGSVHLRLHPMNGGRTSIKWLGTFEYDFAPYHGEHES